MPLPEEAPKRSSNPSGPSGSPPFFSSPAASRILPFGLYIAFLMLESVLAAKSGGTFDPHWLYVAQVALTGVVLVLLWPRYLELRGSQLSLRRIWLAIGVGIIVFVLWRALDQPWARFGQGRSVETALTLGLASPLFAMARIVGAIALVPLMEELFWRSFVMRWIQDGKFLGVVPAQIGTRALVISAVLFALEHHLVVAGAMAGLAYGELYRRTNSLWTVVLAHAVTNAILEFST